MVYLIEHSKQKETSWNNYINNDQELIASNEREINAF